MLIKYLCFLLSFFLPAAKHRAASEIANWQVVAQLSVKGAFQMKLFLMPAECPCQLIAAGKLGIETLLGSKTKAMTHSWMWCYF